MESKSKWSCRKRIGTNINQLLAMPMKKIIRDFHCVTRWSVKNVT